MTRHTKPPFQIDRPIFAKIPLQVHGKMVEVGQQLKWKELKVDLERIITMYTYDMVQHSDDLEETLEPQIGDGLNELNIVALHAIVDKINAKVKLLDDKRVTPCRKSNIKDKQAGHIRSWRLHHGEHE